MTDTRERNWGATLIEVAVQTHVKIERKANRAGSVVQVVSQSKERLDIALKIAMARSCSRRGLQMLEGACYLSPTSKV